MAVAIDVAIPRDCIIRKKEDKKLEKISNRSKRK